MVGRTSSCICIEGVLSLLENRLFKKNNPLMIRTNFEGYYSEYEYPGYEFSEGEFSEDGFPDDEAAENEELDQHFPNVPDWECFEAELAFTRARAMNQRLVNIYALLKARSVVSQTDIYSKRKSELILMHTDWMPFYS